MKEIIITCDVRDSLSVSDLTDLQDTNFKEMSEENYRKLRESLIENGFFVPVHVWKDNNINWILDGHHRIKVLRILLEKEGYTCPLVPVVFIKAQNKKDAAKKLLLINSHYSKITPDGLYQFLEVHEIELDFCDKIELKGHDIEMDNFQQEFYLDAEINEKELDENIETKHECPQCHYKWS